jgi:hypothetical protein
MTRLFFALCLLFLLDSGTAAAEPRTITQDELVRRSQELFDALVPGNQEPFKKYYADDAIFADEKGRTLGKAALVKDVTPLPKGYSGTIKIVNPQSRIGDDFAVLAYDLDETETIFGQELHARYHEIDTWAYRNGKWQIIASQAHRYYEDPATGTADPKEFDAYLGTYELAPGVTMEVTREGDRLFAQRSGRKQEELFPEVPGLFFRKGVEGRRLFHKDASGTVDTLIDRRNNEDIVWKKVK